MKIRITSILILFLISIEIRAAKVPKKMVIEHFTNTLCSVCANRNPGFKTNLAGLDNYTYISIHPSSPYSACTFNLANKRDNDGRTKYYGIYGGTPRLVINGTVISGSANYASPTLFDPFLNDSSSISIKLKQFKTSSNTFRIRVTIKSEEANSLGSVRLFLAVAEDSIDFNAPNGEKKHRSVLRDALTDSSGLQVQIPSEEGDSLVLYFETNIESSWDASALTSIAIIQKTDRSLIQSEFTKSIQNDQELGINDKNTTSFLLFPNPCKSSTKLTFNTNIQAYKVNVIDYNGRVSYTQELNPGQTEIELNLEKLGSGLYTICVHHKNGTVGRILIKE